MVSPVGSNSCLRGNEGFSCLALLSVDSWSRMFEVLKRQKQGFSSLIEQKHSECESEHSLNHPFITSVLVGHPKLHLVCDKMTQFAQRQLKTEEKELLSWFKPIVLVLKSSQKLSLFKVELIKEPCSQGPCWEADLMVVCQILIGLLLLLLLLRLFLLLSFQQRSLCLCCCPSLRQWGPLHPLTMAPGSAGQIPGNGDKDFWLESSFLQKEGRKAACKMAAAVPGAFHG